MSAMTHAHLTPQCTTHSTLPNKFIIRVIRCNRGQYTLKTLCKCAIFGIMCEAIPQQVNYLIDEASDVGNGANTTIRYVHHFFEHHRLG